jgi:Zn-dependent protease
MLGRSYRVASLLGFPIHVDLSWFVVVLLVTWSLAVGYFPAYYGGLGTASYWLMGVAGALGLFASILLHELGHAVVARRFDLAIRKITLFIFGGVAELADEPPHARAEFFVAIGGPLVSVVLAVLSFCGFLASHLIAAPDQLTGVLGFLGLMNFIVVLFNMIPAFPLDGGRVLRSILWQAKGDLGYATRITSNIGSAFGAIMIVLGVFAVIAGNPLGGIWWVVIGLFLRNAATMSYRQLMVRSALEGEPLNRFMSGDPIVVPPGLTVQELVDSYVYLHHHKLFPVVDGNGRLTGCVTTRAVGGLGKEKWPYIAVADIAEPCSDENTVTPDADALEALSLMSRTGNSRLMVVDQGRLVGIVSLKDLLRFLSIKMELGGREPVSVPSPSSSDASERG